MQILDRPLFHTDLAVESRVSVDSKGHYSEIFRMPSGLGYYSRAADCTTTSQHQEEVAIMELSLAFLFGWPCSGGQSGSASDYVVPYFLLGLSHSCVAGDWKLSVVRGDGCHARAKVVWLGIILPMSWGCIGYRSGSQRVRALSVLASAGSLQRWTYA